MYGEFCGKTLPRSFSFYHGKALMMFSSDKTKTEAGFSLAYEGTFLGAKWLLYNVCLLGHMLWLSNIPLIFFMQEVNKNAKPYNHWNSSMPIFMNCKFLKFVGILFFFCRWLASMWVFIEFIWNAILRVTCSYEIHEYQWSHNITNYM